MRRTFDAHSVVILLALALALSGCGGDRFRRPGTAAAAHSGALGRQAECAPRFPDQGGWLGGDAAASVVLPQGDGRSSLWLFGDSFVARSGSPAVRAYPFVHNSIAISHCGDRGDWRLEFAWGNQADGTPQAFFEPDPEAAWVAQLQHETGEAPYYWPISAASVRGTLFVALLRVAPASANGPFRLPFRLVGVDLARIENADRPPAQWTIRYSTLASRTDVLPAASLVVSADHLHAFAFLDRGDGRSPRILTRLPLASLEAWRPALEQDLEALAMDGRWLPGLERAKSRILMDDDASEMSVHFDPDLREWLAVYSDPTNPAGDAPADTIWLRRAESLEGPWSARAALLRIPELGSLSAEGSSLAEGSASVDSNPAPGELFCYAGKAHPELADGGKLLVTYVCNVYAESGDDDASVLERLRTTPSLYRPRAVRVSVPLAVPPADPSAVPPAETPR